MREVILFLFIFALAYRVNAQSAMSSGADNYENSTISISWTIGESVVGTINNGSNILTQGFHQSKLVKTKIESEPAAETFVCEGDEIIMLSVLGSGYGVVNYQWYNSSGIIINETSSNLFIETFPENTDVYYCVVSSGLGNDVQSSNAIVNIDPEFTISEITTVCYGDSYMFPDGTTQENITSQTVHISYLQTKVSLCDSTIETTVNISPTRCSMFNSLSVGNETIVANDENCFNAFNTITVAGDGTTVLVEDGGAATFIAEVSIRFLPGFYAEQGSSVSATITTDGTFCNDSAQVATNEPVAVKSVADDNLFENIDERNPSKLIVFPNPNNGAFNVKLENIVMPAQLVVYNAVGKKVYQTLANDNNVALDIATVNSGIYFVKVVAGSKQLTKKLVVNK